MSENAWCDSSASSVDQQPATESNYEAKIFVGGLEWSTTADELRIYFEKYGTVLECEIKTDHHTGQSRGFAFVTFADPSSVEAVVNVRDHFIGGRKIDPKKIKLRDALKPIHKIFVGGVDASITEDAIREYFGQFGSIDEIDFPFDHQRQERRHFCFIRFTSNEPVERLCRQPFHTIGGQTVEIKKMMNKSEKLMQPSGMSNYSSYDFGHRGRGGGRGMSAFNAGSVHPMAGYGTSYVDSRQQPSWQHQGMAEYGVSDFGSVYGGGLRQSSMYGHNRLPSMSASYGSSSYGLMADSASSFRDGRQPLSSAGRGSRQPSASSYGLYGDSRYATGTAQDFVGVSDLENAKGDGIAWSAPVGYQPRYSGNAAMSQQSYIRSPAASSGMTRGQRYQPYSR